MAKASSSDTQLPLFEAGELPPEAEAAARERQGLAQEDASAGAPQPVEEPAPAEEALEPPPEPEVLSVGELDRRVKRMLERATAGVLVQGEVSGLRRAGSGHVYFCLKDQSEDALIDCVTYRSAPARARARLQEGERVVVRGRITLYPPRGRLQMVVDDVLQTARGALLEAQEKLKKKLAAEGLFDAARKKPLPRDPRRIAVLTSRDGAAFHDVVEVAFRRGKVHLLLVPTPVQGAGAAPRIARAIRLADELGMDAIVVTRGGGAAEDLAAYDDEEVVRAIAAARTPVVSAVGHEIDVSLSDLVADARAATPSQAAELLVPDFGERLSRLEQLRGRLGQAQAHRLSRNRESLGRLRGRLGEPRTLVFEHAQRFDELGRALERATTRGLERRARELTGLERRLEAQHPRRVLGQVRLALGALGAALREETRAQIGEGRQLLAGLGPRLPSAMQARLRRCHHELERSASHLDALSPLAVLGRGYAIASSDGRVLADARQSRPGDQVVVRLHRGRLVTRVESVDDGEGASREG